MDAEDKEREERIARLLARAKGVEQDREQLPCLPHEMNDEEGAAACEDVGSHKWCPWNGTLALCARSRVIDSAVDVKARLVAGKVPLREYELILAAARREAKLLPLDPLQAIRARLAGKPWGCGTLRGTEAIVVLAGPRGVGKTLAGCYAIGRQGGIYLLVYQFARPGLDIDGLIAPPIVVVDQVGRESPSSDWFASQFEEVIDRRYAAKKLSILIGNVSREQFSAAYDRIIEDRMRGDGAFVELTGKSMRGAQP